MHIITAKCDMLTCQRISVIIIIHTSVTTTLIYPICSKETWLDHHTLYSLRALHCTLTLYNSWPQLLQQVNRQHSIANKTVVQLQPKSSTRSGFYWSISGTFVLRYDPSANFAVWHVVRVN